MERGIWEVPPVKRQDAERIDRDGSWNVLQLYGLDGRLLRSSCSYA